MVYQCHKCKKDFIQRTDFRRHLNRKIDCLNIPLEDRVAAKVLGVLKNEFNKGNITAIMNTENNNIAIPEINFLDVSNGVADQQENLENPIELNQESLEDRIHREQRAEMSIADVHTKMKELGIPDLLYASGKNKGKIHKNRNHTVAHCLKWARSDKAKEVKEEGDAEEIKTSSGNSIVSCVNACHNILRNRDSIVGAKAMHDIMRLLFMKFLEPLINIGQIDMLDKKYYVEVKFFKEGLEQNAKYSEFKKNTLSDSVKHTKMVWKIIFAKYHMTKDIFNEDDYFNCSQTTLITLLSKIDSDLKDEKFDNLDNDVKGKLYEEFLNGYSNNAGKDFGQYFTTRDYIRLIFKQISQEVLDQFKSLVKAGKFLAKDTCMGTAGFLTETYEFLNLERNIKMLKGCEIEAETYNYALMNLILTTGTLHPNNFVRVDSLVCCNPLEKVNFIPTNPPYGTKMDYKDLMIKYNAMYSEELKDKTFPKFKDIYPIKTNDGVALFLQMMVFILAPGGLCVPIVPNGQVLFGKNYKKLRKYIMGKCAVEKIMYTPGGVFKHAGVKTAVLYLRKYDDDELAEIKENVYNDLNLVEFVETNKQLDDPKVLGSIVVDEENMFSWDFSYYKAQATPDWGGVEWKPLGELFTLLSTTKHKTSLGNSSGKHRFYNSSQNQKLYLDTCEIKQESVIIGNGGNANIHIDSNFTASKHVTVCVPLDGYKKSNRYMYLYLLHNTALFENASNGSGITWLNKDSIRKIKIPVPSLEVQAKIVKQLNELQEGKERHRQLLADKKQYMGLYREHAQPPFADHKDQIEWKPLGELCGSSNGKSLTKSNFKEGSYPVIGGGQSPVGFHKEFNTLENTILCSSSGAYAGYLSKYETKVWKSDCFSIEPINEQHKNYIWYYLKYNQEKLYLFQTGSGQPHVYWRDLQHRFKIPVPPLEVQTEFVKFYEAKEQKLNELQQDIDNTEQYLKWLDDLGRMVIENTICKE
jgi:type I restriction-modification system DNA methylase subunit/restriction endonuclease S subunit